jgi:hypothetical protein
MTKRATSLNDDSAVNSVAARLAVYVALAGAAGAGAALALRRHNRKIAPEHAPEDDQSTPAALRKTDVHLAGPGQGASVKAT